MFFEITNTLNKDPIFLLLINISNPFFITVFDFFAILIIFFARSFILNLKKNLFEKKFLFQVDFFAISRKDLKSTNDVISCFPGLSNALATLLLCTD